jgi:hypothetical protein
MPSAIRIHMLRAFLEFLAEHHSPLSRYDASWRWIASEKGLAAHKWATPDPTPIRFTVFGFVTHAVSPKSFLFLIPTPHQYR